MPLWFSVAGPPPDQAGAAPTGEAPKCAVGRNGGAVRHLRTLPTSARTAHRSCHNCTPRTRDADACGAAPSGGLAGSKPLPFGNLFSCVRSSDAITETRPKCPGHLSPNRWRSNPWPDQKRHKSKTKQASYVFPTLRGAQRPRRNSVLAHLGITTPTHSTLYLASEVAPPLPLRICWEVFPIDGCKLPESPVEFCEPGHTVGTFCFRFRNSDQMACRFVFRVSKD